MRKYIFLIATLFNVTCSFAQTKHVTLSFNSDDFTIKTESSGIISVSSCTNGAFLKEDTTTARVPYYIVNITIPYDKYYMGSQYTTINSSMLAQNVSLAHNRTLCSTSDSTYTISDVVGGANVPSEKVRFITSEDFGTCRMVKFEVCPFAYDTDNQNLYLLSSVSVDIQYGDGPNNAYGNNDEYRCAVPTDVISSLISDFDDNPQYNEQYTEILSTDDVIDYLIVTSDSLVNGFQNLINWKHQKGLATAIKTMESIDAEYNDSTIQLKLKHYLLDMYTNHRTKFVLLGGDETVVPVQMCYADTKGRHEYTPADYFYACFNGALDWNANHNDKIGEYTDGFDLIPFIYVTRALVSNVGEAMVFSRKIKHYETNPKTTGEKLSILFTGYEFYPESNDTYYKSVNLYNNFIQPYWNGNKYTFFKNFIDLPEETPRYFNVYSFQDRLKYGYDFVSVACHGNVEGWRLGNVLYDTFMAERVGKIKTPIITTTACNTNAFDNTTGKCLAEAIMKTESNATVAYYGASRQTWVDYKNDLLEVPGKFEAEFYKYLFTSENEPNFGRAVAVSKIKNNELAMAPDCDRLRWHHFTMNPIGDPEMPIYIKPAKKFNNDFDPNRPLSEQVIRTYINGEIHFPLNAEHCKVCIMSKNDNGESIYRVFVNADSVSATGLSGDLLVTVTHEGYKPLVLEYREANFGPISGGTINVNSVNGNIIDLDVSANSSNGLVQLSNVMGQQEDAKTVNSETENIDLRTKGAGTHIINLIIDGQIVESKQVMTNE